MYSELANEEGIDQSSDPDIVTAEVKDDSELDNEEGIDQNANTEDSAEHNLEDMYSTIDIATAECVAYHTDSNFSETGTAEGDSTVAYDYPSNYAH